MRNFSFENQGTNTYLVYTVSPDDSVDSMSLGMLTNNKIPGLAPAIFTQMDTTKFIKYNISAHISVKQFFSGPVNKKRLIGVFNGIVDAMLSAEDYMIDVNSILLDLDYMFADVSTCETVLICLPVVDTEGRNMDLGAFFKNIMFCTQFDQTENCDHVAKIMNYLNSNPVFSLVDFKELLGQISSATAPAPAPAPVAQQPKVPQTTVPQTAPATDVTRPAVVQPTVPKTVTPVAPAQDNNIKTPPMPVKEEAPAAAEKKMSMMDLLMHYSKENAAIYKAQKQAAKDAAAATPQKQPKQKAAPAGAMAGFAIPGQAAPSVAAEAPAPVATEKSIPQPVATPAPVPQSVVTPQPVVTPAPAPQGYAMNFGETTVLGGGNIGETTVLGMETQVKTEAPHLIRSKNNEKINLNKPVFRIGKEKSYVDYFIGDNTAISRSHANFISRDGAYFVVDTNSTNHTYVNGAMIQSNVETKIAHGDKVRLANEDFEFKLY